MLGIRPQCHQPGKDDDGRPPHLDDVTGIENVGIVEHEQCPYRRHHKTEQDSCPVHSFLLSDRSCGIADAADRGLSQF
jgi:hypothetical protein